MGESALRSAEVAALTHQRVGTKASLLLADRKSRSLAVCVVHQGRTGGRI